MHGYTSPDDTAFHHTSDSTSLCPVSSYLASLVFLRAAAAGWSFMVWWFVNRWRLAAAAGWSFAVWWFGKWWWFLSGEGSTPRSCSTLALRLRFRWRSKLLERAKWKCRKLEQFTSEHHNKNAALVIKKHTDATKNVCMVTSSCKIMPTELIKLLLLQQIVCTKA